MNEVNLVLILIILFFVYLNIVRYQTEYFFAVPTGDERPFVNVYDDKRNQQKIILLSHPFTRDSSYEQYKRYKKDKFIVLGISSYNEFPKITTNKHDVLNNPKEKAWTDYDYMKVADGWLHCFRKPSKYIENKKMPKLLLSESDFCDTELYKPDASVKKEYDFLYICPKDGEDCDGWVATNKNWALAQKCIEIMCLDYNLKGLLVGRKGCKLPDRCEKNLETTGWLSQMKLSEAFHKSKFILIPNESDASPRILTEAMCSNCCVLVNYNIVGGWKYISKDSGAFFKSEDDLRPGLEYILNNYKNMKPRQHYMNNYGKENSGRKFKKFIEKHFSDRINLKDTKYLTL